ncbi:MAG: glycine cleavage system protein H, partial [Clostridia bacterium]
SEVFCPVSGKVIAVNDELLTSPELINEKPYDAWFIEVQLTAVSDKLLDATAYADIAK